VSDDEAVSDDVKSVKAEAVAAVLARSALNL
jgi:hypothetical protein